MTQDSEHARLVPRPAPFRPYRKRKKVDPAFATWPAMRALKAKGYYFDLHDPNHLQVDCVHYWPSTGRVYVDRAAASEPERGFDAFIATIERVRQMPTSTEISNDKAEGTPRAPEAPSDDTNA